MNGHSFYPSAFILPPLEMPLFICATPIGNLDDVSLRLLATLRDADLILAEDTRHTRALLSRHEIHTPLASCHEHTSPAKLEILAQRMADGETFALVTDAGTPGVSDPGPPLVRAAFAKGVEVSPIPGPCALAAALSVSGLDAQRFSFLGFLPRKPGRRRRAVEESLARGETLVFYESPYRVLDLLKLLAEAAPTRPVCVCRELTKKFEEAVRGPASEVMADFAARKDIRGEFVVVVGGESDDEED
jgi:16S rRNA (cytidine1402-2'-O)-methyltransferase